MAIGRVNTGGGGSGAYAFVIVNYPAGSAVSCTNTTGGRDITETQRIFYVKKGATDCTVTITQGDKTATKTVEGITEGSSTNVTLAFELIIYDNGSTDYTWATKSASLGTDCITASVTVSYGAYPEAYARNNESIDFTNYKTLMFIATRDSSKFSSAYLDIYSSAGTRIYRQEISVATKKTYTLDISDNTVTDGYVRIYVGGAGESGIGGGSYETVVKTYYIGLQ